MRVTCTFFAYKKQWRNYQNSTTKDDSIFHILDQIKVSIKDIFVNRALPCFAMRVTWKKILKKCSGVKISDLTGVSDDISWDCEKDYLNNLPLPIYKLNTFQNLFFYLPTYPPQCLPTYLPTQPNIYVFI